MKTLYSLIESPFAPDFRALYDERGYRRRAFRQCAQSASRAAKKPPDFFVGEFVYGWGNNYAGANVSNLDVTLRTLQCVAPAAKLIVFLQPREAAHIDKLLDLFPIDAVLTYPVDEAQMRAALLAAA
jgi:hypothetical protein